MCLFFSMLFCMVINVTIERIGYKPLRNQPRLAPLITAIGFSFILQDIGLVWKDAGRSRSDILPTGDIFHWRGRRTRWNDFIVIRGHGPAPHRAPVSRAPNAPARRCARRLRTWTPRR